MNKRIYIIATIIVVLLVVAVLIGGGNKSPVDGIDTLATTTDAGATVNSSTTIATTTSTNATASTSVVTSSAKVYTMTEVASHNNANSCWSAIDGKVYDLTKAIDVHPGGREKILKICGKDGSSAFGKQHGENTEIVAALQTMVIGDLKK